MDRMEVSPHPSVHLSFSTLLTLAQWLLSCPSLLNIGSHFSQWKQSVSVVSFFLHSRRIRFISFVRTREERRETARSSETDREKRVCYGIFSRYQSSCCVMLTVSFSLSTSRTENSWQSFRFLSWTSSHDTCERWAISRRVVDDLPVWYWCTLC